MTPANHPKRILVVDDDICLRNLISAVLTTQGYEVDTAEDGVQGWYTIACRDSSQALAYDLLVTDNNMPKLAGTGLIGKLRSAGIDLPIILASGNVPSNAENLGLAAIVPKPFLPGVLLDAVEQAFKR